MATPRRAAEEAVEITIDTPTSSPRRGAAPSLGWRKAIAPVAIAGALVAATTWGVSADEQTFDAFPGPSASVHTVGVEREHPALPVSRADERTPLEEPTVSARATSAPQALEAVPEATPSQEPTPSASPTPEPTPTPTPTPTPSEQFTTLGEDGQAKWTNASVNIRSGPGTDFDVVNSYGSGTKVTTTSVTHEGWQQINLRGKAAWIHARYLTNEQPAAPSRSEERSASAAETEESSGTSTASCSRASGIEGGLTNRTRSVLRAVCNAFPSISNYGGARSGGGSYHSSGRAIDVMVSGERGWEVARWARANASELGIIEVIYAQSIWTTQRSGEGWRPMSDRGSASANHYDHVHISVR